LDQVLTLIQVIRDSGEEVDGIEDFESWVRKRIRQIKDDREDQGKSVSGVKWRENEGKWDGCLYPKNHPSGVKWREMIDFRNFYPVVG
jgi:hypothetical protein